MGGWVYKFQGSSCVSAQISSTPPQGGGVVMYFKCFKFFISLDNNAPFIPHPHIMKKVLTQGAGIRPNFCSGILGGAIFMQKNT